MSCVAPVRTLALAHHSTQVIDDSRPPHLAWSDKGGGREKMAICAASKPGTRSRTSVGAGTLGCLERLGRMSPRAHTGNAHATREVAIGKPHPGAAEAAVISLLDMEARLERHALERRANRLAFYPECARRQTCAPVPRRGTGWCPLPNRPQDAAGAARAIETMKREKLAGYEAPRGIGVEAFRAGRAGCEQDQNHHCQSSNHTEPLPSRSATATSCS